VYANHGFKNDSTVKGVDGLAITMSSGNTYRFRPNGTRPELFARGQVNPFGLAFDERGDLFSADCHTRPQYMLLRGAVYPSFGKPDDGLGFGPEMCPHDHGSTGIAGTMVYAADRFPAEYRNNLFNGNPVTNTVNRDRVEWAGSTPRAVPEPDFLVSADPWFRPVQVVLGPDGAMYVADFYNKIIGHYEVDLKHPGRDRTSGRIWRIVYKGDAATRRRRRGDGPDEAGRGRLVGQLATRTWPSAWRRRTRCADGGTAGRGRPDMPAWSPCRTATCGRSTRCGRWSGGAGWSPTCWRGAREPPPARAGPRDAGSWPSGPTGPSGSSGWRTPGWPTPTRSSPGPRPTRRPPPAPGPRPAAAGARQGRGRRHAPGPRGPDRAAGTSWRHRRARPIRR
jgi:hypothetical protein